MDYRTILVDLTTERSVATNVPVAINLADRFDATCIGLHVMSEPDPATSHPTAAPRAARDLVMAAFQRSAGSNARIEWTEAEGGPEQLLVEWALTVDLTVVAQHQPEGQSAPDIADQLIIASGVPTLMLPPQAATELGVTILVGWNGSREATRAVHEALPFLVRAQRVVVCAVGDVAIEKSGLGGRDAAATWRASGAGSDGRARRRLLRSSSATRRGLTAPICWSSAAMATRAGSSCSSGASRSTCCAMHRFLSYSAADAWQRREADHDGPGREQRGFAQ